MTASEAGYPGGAFWGRLREVTTAELAALLEARTAEGLLLEYKRFGDPGAPPSDCVSCGQKIKGVATGSYKLEDLADVLCSMANTAGGRVILGAEADNEERLIGFKGVGAQQKATIKKLRDEKGVEAAIRGARQMVEAKAKT